MSCLINDSGEGTKGLDLGEEDGSPLRVPIGQSLADKYTGRLTSAGLVGHPSVVKVSMLVCGDDLLRGTTEVGMDIPPSNCLPNVSGDERWFGFANHYIKGTVVWTRYVLMMQCLST